MNNIDLEKYGILGTKEIVYNPSHELLYEEETNKWLYSTLYNETMKEISLSEHIDTIVGQNFGDNLV